MIKTKATPIAQKLSAYMTLSDSDWVILKNWQEQTKIFSVDQDIVHQGQAKRAAYVLSSGWVCSYKLQSDGTRQIVDIQIPGDFLGLRSAVFRVSDHSFMPITTVAAAVVPTDDLLATFSKSPKLAAAILWAVSRDEAMLVEHLVGIGRRDAERRVAHFLLELAARLQLVGMGDRTGYDCPLTQYHLADTLGLSAIHVNRVLRRLREMEMVTFQHGHVTVLDDERLIDFAEFDASYLDQMTPILG